MMPQFIVDGDIFLEITDMKNLPMVLLSLSRVSLQNGRRAVMNIRMFRVRF
jgi:hypothetical protein